MSRPGGSCPRPSPHLGDLVNDNPGQADRVREIRSLTDQRAVILAALVANVQANRPPQSRVELLDRNKEVADALIGQLQAMKNEEQRPARRPPGPGLPDLDADPWARSG